MYKKAEVISHMWVEQQESPRIANQQEISIDLYHFKCYINTQLLFGIVEIVTMIAGSIQNSNFAALYTCSAQ